MELEAALSLSLEEELDWSMIMRTELPLYDSYEAPKYTEPYGPTMSVKLVADRDNNRLEEELDWQMIKRSEMPLYNSYETPIFTKSFSPIITDLLVVHPDIIRVQAPFQQKSHWLMMHSKMLMYKSQGGTCTELYGQTMRDKLVVDLYNNRLGISWTESLKKINIRAVKLIAGQEENRLASSYKKKVKELQLRLDKLNANLEKNSARRSLRTVPIFFGIGRFNKTNLLMHGLPDFDSNTMFRNIDRKKLVRSIYNIFKEQSWTPLYASDGSARRKIKDIIDLALGMDKQNIIRERGINMYTLRRIIGALHEKCKHAHGRGIPRPTTFDRFCVRWCSSFNHGLYRVHPICTQCHLWETLPAGDRSSKTAIDTRRHLRKIRRNKVRNKVVVPRRRLAQKTQDQNRMNRGLFSRSDPIAADNASLTPEQTWRVASAAPQHMTGYLNHLVDYTPASGDQVIIDTPNMGRMAVHGRGSVNTANMTLGDVLYVPGLDANLVSTGQLAQLGYTIAIGPYGCRVYKDDGSMNLVGKAHYVDAYLLELDFLRVN